MSAAAMLTCASLHPPSCARLSSPQSGVAGEAAQPLLLRVRFRSTALARSNAVRAGSVRAAVEAVPTPETPSSEAKKFRPGEKKGFIEEMRIRAMKLHTKDQAKEGEEETKERPLAKWEPSKEGLVQFLVDSKAVFDAMETVVRDSDLHVYRKFLNTGLERSDALAKDLAWFESQGFKIPPPDEAGSSYAKYLAELARSDTPAFICHFYNVYFAHSAGGRMIGRKVGRTIACVGDAAGGARDGVLPVGWDPEVSEMLLEGREMVFDQWEGVGDAAGGAGDGVLPVGGRAAGSAGGRQREAQRGGGGLDKGAEGPLLRGDREPITLNPAFYYPSLPMPPPAIALPPDARRTPSRNSRTARRRRVPSSDGASPAVGSHGGAGRKGVAPVNGGAGRLDAVGGEAERAHEGARTARVGEAAEAEGGSVRKRLRGAGHATGEGRARNEGGAEGSGAGRSDVSQFLRSWVWKREGNILPAPLPSHPRIPPFSPPRPLLSSPPRPLALPSPRSSVAGKYLERHAHLVHGKTCIELGAGCGLLGTTLAVLGARTVVVTDMPGNLPLLHRNVQANALHHAVHVQPLRWGNTQDACALSVPASASSSSASPTPCSTSHEPTISSTDVVYDHGAVPPLVTTLAMLCAPHSSVLLAHGRNRQALPEFLRLAGERFRVKAVAWEDLDETYRCEDVQCCAPCTPLSAWLMGACNRHALPEFLPKVMTERVWVRRHVTVLRSLHSSVRMGHGCNRQALPELLKVMQERVWVRAVAWDDLHETYQ
ncbi:unnamed protein product [Closterium sp. Naga37s-1]|nr:unnamed protein product [Closterium sp. Naga37s-1]